MKFFFPVLIINIFFANLLNGKSFLEKYLNLKPKYFPCYVARGQLKYCDDKNYRLSHSFELKIISLNQSIETRPLKILPLDYRNLSKKKKKSSIKNRISIIEKYNRSRDIINAISQQKN